MSMDCNLHDRDMYVTHISKIANTSFFLLPVELSVLSAWNVLRLQSSVEVHGAASRVHVLHSLQLRLKLYPLIFLIAFVPRLLCMLC